MCCTILPSEKLNGEKRENSEILAEIGYGAAEIAALASTAVTLQEQGPVGAG